MATRATADERGTGAFSDAEKAAMKERAAEAKAARRKAPKVDPETELLAKVADLPDEDRAVAEALHAVVRRVAPDLTPRTWYGMPAYAKDGKVLCFLQPASKFGTRYATLGFNDVAQLDDGTLWPTSFAITTMGAAEEETVAELVRRAVG